MRCCDTFTLFSIEAEQCTRCSRPAWQKLANITRKTMLRVGVVKQEQSAWFIYTNERTVFSGYCSLHIRSNDNNSQVFFTFWVFYVFLFKKLKIFLESKLVKTFFSSEEQLFITCCTLVFTIKQLNFIFLVSISDEHFIHREEISFSFRVIRQIGPISQN